MLAAPAIDFGEHRQDICRCRIDAKQQVGQAAAVNQSAQYPRHEYPGTGALKFGDLERITCKLTRLAVALRQCHANLQKA